MCGEEDEREQIGEGGILLVNRSSMYSHLSYTISAKALRLPATNLTRTPVI